MKKYLLTLVLAAATLASSADTFSPGGRWNHLPSATTGQNSQVPVQWDVDTYGSQSIFAGKFLSDIAPVTNAEGKTSAVISKITFPILLSEVYGLEGTADLEVWLDNSELESFPEVNGKMQWHQFGDGAHAKLTIDPANELWEYYSAETVEIEIPLDEPLKYEGGSLVFTVKSSSEITDIVNAECWCEGSYDLNLNVLAGGSSAVSSAMTYSHNLTGALGTKLYTSPVIQFTYEKVTEAFAPEIQRGEPTEWKSVGYDNPTLESSSAFCQLPITSQYEAFVSQAVYTTLDLAGLKTLNDDGTVTTAEISDLYFAVRADGAANGIYNDSFELEYKVYVQNTDLEGMPLNRNGNVIWADIAEDAAVGSGKLEFYFMAEGEEWPEEIWWGDETPMYLHVKLSEPIMYDGKSLLISWESTCDTASDVISGWAGFKSKNTNYNSGTSEKRSGYSTTTALWDAGAPNHYTDYRGMLPAIKFGYVPVTEKSSLVPVLIENVVPGIATTTVETWGKEEDGKTDKLNKTEVANVLTLTFDINDPTACGEYEIKLGTQSLGITNGTTATVSYFARPTADMIISVEPKGEGTVGTTYTITPEMFDGYFAAPTISVEGKRAYAAFKAHKTTSVEVAGAAQFAWNVESEIAPIAKLQGSATTQAVKMVYGTDEDWLSDWTAPSDFSNFHTANGRRAYWQSNLFQGVKFERGELETTKTASIAIQNAGIDYPVAVKTALDLGGVSETVDSKLAAVTTYKVAATKASTLSARIDLGNPEHLTLDIEYPDGLVSQINADGTVTFFAPEAHELHYFFTPATAPARAAAEDPYAAYTATGQNYYTFDPTEMGNGRLHVISKLDGEVMHEQTLRFDENGISGIASVEADNAGQVEYFNLQGMRLTQTPAAGIYLRRSGSKVEKVVVK